MSTLINRAPDQLRGSGEFFDSFARDFDTLYDGKRNIVMRWVDRQFRSDMFGRFDRTFELLGDLRGRSVLDIGCGSGPYIQEALRRGADKITGIDPAEAMLQLVRERVANSSRPTADVTLLQGYFPQVTPARSHDCAIVMGVLDYVEDSVAFIRALRGTVSRGAAISFPSVHWLRSPIRRVRYRWRKCPLFLYTEADIRQIMRSAGVERYQIHKLPGAGMDFVVWMQP
jgi:2-polyprenyl-3-methyl-5-hydroxy-6-metoxy-1,4-benzoquinol methylase